MSLAVDERQSVDLCHRNSTFKLTRLSLVCAAQLVREKDNSRGIFICIHLHDRLREQFIGNHYLICLQSFNLSFGLLARLCLCLCLYCIYTFRIYTHILQY